MAEERKSQGEGSSRGFAGMEQEKQREIARKRTERKAQLRAEPYSGFRGRAQGRAGCEASAPQLRTKS